ncbi:MAG: FlgD immunoglobulin-like domain containing protein [bacterium]
MNGNTAVHPETAPATGHEFFVGLVTAVVTHDFESATGWTVGDTGDEATTGIWERVDPNGTWLDSTPVQPEDDATDPPGQICYITGNAAVGAGQGDNDVDGGKTTLLSPVFDLSGYGYLRVAYRRWYTNDTGNNPMTDDWYVDVSDDGGVEWIRLETSTSSDRSWRLVERNLHDYIDLTTTVQFRFVASDDSQGSIVEAGVDDFSLLEFQSPLSAVEIGPAGPVLSPILGQNMPNPFNPSTVISFEVPAEGRQVTLRVYDLAGRVVATLLADEKIAGPRIVRWLGCDDAGRAVASGVYMYRLTAGETQLTRKMMLLR